MADKAVIIINKNENEEVKKVVLSKLEQLLWWNFDVSLKEIFEMQRLSLHIRNVDKRYSLKNDINLVHMRNFTFKENLLIQGISSRDELKGDTLILENCIFEAENLWVEFFSNVVILNPILVNNNNTRMNMHFMFCDDVRIVLNETNERLFGVYGLRGVKKFNLDASGCNVDVMLAKPNEVYLKNINESSCLDIRYGNITIESSTLIGERVHFHADWADKARSNSLNFINSIFDACCYYFKSTKELNMVDSYIISNNISYNDIEKIYLRNSHIVAFEHGIWLGRVCEMIIDDREEDSILDNSSYLEAKEFITTRDKFIRNKDLDANLIIDKNDIEKEFLFKNKKSKTLSKKL